MMRIRLRAAINFLAQGSWAAQFVQNLVRNAEKDNYNYSSNNNSKQNNRKFLGLSFAQFMK